MGDTMGCGVRVVKPFEVSIHLSKLTGVYLKLRLMTLKMRMNKEDLNRAAPS